MVARKTTKVKGKTSKKAAQRKKIARNSVATQSTKKASKRPAKKKTTNSRIRSKKAAKKTVKKKTIKKVSTQKIPTKKIPTKKSPVKKKPAKKKPAKKITAQSLTPRQQAAIKGWKTRHKKARKKAKRQKEARIRQIRAYPSIKGVDKAYAKEIARLEKEAQEAFEKGRMAGIEEAEAKRQLELSEAEKRRLFLEKQFVESDQSTILSRLWLAADYGELEQEIDDVAEEFDMDVSEIYDLYYSPEAQ